LGVTVQLRHLSRDARALLLAAGRARPDAAVFVEADDDPVYDVAAAAPVPLKDSELKANEPPRQETVVVQPEAPDDNAARLARRLRDGVRATAAAKAAAPGGGA